MKLLTAEIKKSMPKMGSTEIVPTAEKVAVCKFFDPCGRYTYYVVEGAPTEDGDYEFFGYCVSPLGPDCDEWGYATLNEIASVKNKLGLGIERDLWFKPTKITELVKEAA
jgi:hypothetical protein